jgi:indolepyruvate ferredoxin oxidoreductase, alpha subunit
LGASENSLSIEKEMSYYRGRNQRKSPSLLQTHHQTQGEDLERAMKNQEVERTLMMGNEAIARGALEGGVSYCTGYPGNPSSEIIESLLPVQRKYRIRVEWAVNEIVALEAAAAFSFSGLRAMVTMKQNGINVCSDFLTTVCLSELRGGLLLVVCDDPGPLTSSNEEDSRHFAKIAQIPLLEPSTSQDAKDMTRWALELSERTGLPCMLRSVSRLSHGRGGVRLGPVTKRDVKPSFDIQKPLVGLPFLVTINHGILLKKMKRVQAVFNKSSFNTYQGPRNPRLLIMATGLGVLQAKEAIKSLDLDDQIGVLKIGTSWPLPENLIRKYLRQAKEVLFVEEIDPFLEDQVKVIYAESSTQLGAVMFYGKNTGDIGGSHGPGVGELNTDIVLDAVRRIFKIRKPKGSSYQKTAIDRAARLLVPRELSFCQGCPHRASFFAIKAALELDGRKGFVVGDIGCYGLGAGVTGFDQIKVLHCMGSGMGNVSGFSQLSSFGFDQPAVAVVGDSTFYHAGLPALVNARFNHANALFVVLDNSVTAMTGFQVNPASFLTGSGEPSSSILVEEMTRGLGIKTTVLDPVEDIQKAIMTVYGALQEEGVKVIVFRRICSTYEARVGDRKQWFKAKVEAKKCIGKACGCNRFCSRVLSCPAIQYDNQAEKAFIRENACNGCGLCIQLCPMEAISLAAIA